MSLCQIVIYRKVYGEPVDMQAVYAALLAAGIDVDKQERAPGDVVPPEDEQPEYVFVDDDVSRAVHIINGLGYSTDEDEEEEEE